LTRVEKGKQTIMKISATARQRWIALTLLSTIEFMILLDTSIVNIALPSIARGWVLGTQPVLGAECLHADVR